ncbi:MFS transporter [Oceanomicrobium pacificus]|uniref:MFS transporter n=1 Tax=Oceanomicrobium pacificus TaxID=2692916 RepID=A0A6B0TW40_9RHOB|nr:MFS transporter [Oceanomicrobium pacificus]MXU65778.1 MFS transporter [Oceanomicrobium pacificus]
MFSILTHSWPLLLGVLLLMMGNGLQGSLLGVRGALEGFDAKTMSYVMSGYFLGFLGGSRLTPVLIAAVGHVRVFAALASLISAAFILYPALPYPAVWVALRVLVGFCFSGVYVVAESWLNDAATNETRGKALSLYMIVQMTGIVGAQILLNLADVSGYTLFVVMSVLVSLSFTPILLSDTYAPVFRATKPLTLRQLYEVSPLGCVAIFLLGGVFSAIFGMASVYATEKGLTISELSIFVAAVYVGGLLFQYPVGLMSDRIDRRRLIMAMTVIGALAMAVALPFTTSFTVLIGLAVIIGGTANPLYSLTIAYTNDFLEPEDMAAASGRLMFINGIGAIAGPLVLGAMMQAFGADSFFVFLLLLYAMIAAYAVYRMTQRAAPEAGDTISYSPIMPQATPVAVELAQEIAAEEAIEMAEEQAAEETALAEEEASSDARRDAEDTDFQKV